MRKMEDSWKRYLRIVTPIQQRVLKCIYVLQLEQKPVSKTHTIREYVYLWISEYVYKRIDVCDIFVY